MYGRYSASDKAVFKNANSAGTILTYVTEADVKENEVTFTFDGWKYGIMLEQGKMEGNTISLCNGKLLANMAANNKN